MKIVKLTKEHDRNSFSCGVSSLDNFIKDAAIPNGSIGRINTQVAINQSDPVHILGFYSTATLNMNYPKDIIIPGISKRRAKGQIEGMLLVKLAVDSKYKNQGIGSELVINLFKNYLDCLKVIPLGTGIFVDILNPDVASFYEGFGFSRIEDSSRLFMCSASIESFYNQIY